MPNLMYRNRAGTGFADITSAGGFGHLQKGNGVAIADLDGDGDEDVFLQVGGLFPGDAFADVLFQNPGTANHWLGVRLVGNGSNRSAIGARIRRDITEHGARRSIYRQVSSGGSFGANPLRQMIGVGAATMVDRSEIQPGQRPTRHRLWKTYAFDQNLEIIRGTAELIPLSNSPRVAGRCEGALSFGVHDDVAAAARRPRRARGDGAPSLALSLALPRKAAQGGERTGGPR